MPYTSLMHDPGKSRTVGLRPVRKTRYAQAADSCGAPLGTKHRWAHPRLAQDLRIGVTPEVFEKRLKGAVGTPDPRSHGKKKKTRQFLKSDQKKNNARKNQIGVESFKWKGFFCIKSVSVLENLSVSTEMSPLRWTCHTFWGWCKCTMPSFGYEYLRFHRVMAQDRLSCLAVDL